MVRAACVPLVLLLIVCPGSFAAADPWTVAITRNDVGTIDVMVRSGVDVNSAAADGKTALMAAARKGRIDLVRALLRDGAHINATNSRGGTALMYAAVGGGTPTVRLLLRQGASARPAGTNGWTALTIASAKGFADVVGLLLSYGADVNARDVYGWTPLSRAAYEKRADVVQLLLEQPGLAVDAVDDQGASALHHAAAQGATPVVRLLIAHGADRELEDASGRTAAMRAHESGYPNIAMLVDEPARRQ